MTKLVITEPNISPETKQAMLEFFKKYALPKMIDKLIEKQCEQQTTKQKEGDTK